ncbi:DUF2178 domain-containing protein [Candidatus Woesearchaeota archaeon]|nr:DUF2178 domain-containing protein [Candidatus Woesearchaeota archaeon]
MKTKIEGKEKIRMIALIIVSLFVIVTGILFSLKSFTKGNIAGGIGGGIIAIIILVFAIFVFRRGNRDMKEGYPLKDERSRKVIEKASSLAFYVTLYLLLAIGFLSDDIIKFRDISQATSLAVAGMAILFVGFWAYYNKKEI